MDMYLIGSTSSTILLGSEIKKVILQYVNAPKKDFQSNSFTSARKSQLKLLSVLEFVDENLLLDNDFKNKLLGLANTEELLNSDNLNPELIKNEKFLKNYINLLSQKGIDSETIINALTGKEEYISEIKTNTELIQLIFEQITPSNLEKFFDIFFSKEELENFFANEENLSGKMLRLSQLYAKDSTILESLNGKLLGKKYQNIPNYKMQLIAKNPKFQDQILGLNDYQYLLYSKMTQLVSQKTDRWNRFEQNIVSNLSDGFYNELIQDLYKQAKQGNKISNQDIETLLLLFSGENEKEWLNIFRSQGLGEKEIKQKEISLSNNIFNITNKRELEHFEEIKELVCDTILTNPSLDDEQLIKPIGKHLEKFKQLSELDRIKLALLEKYYNMNLEEAHNIVSNFSIDIDNMHADDEYQASIIEQIKAIRNIFESEDINKLIQVGKADILTQTDLSLSTYLIEQTKELFEKAYKETLYMPKEEDKIGNTTFNGKNIEIFDGGTNFSMLVKRIGVNDDNSQAIWNKMTKEGEYGIEHFRYYTCCSYMTDENILEINQQNEVILGFAKGAEPYSFDAIYTHDAHTPYYGGDGIFNSLDSTYMMPPTLQTNTANNYNEIVVNTLGVNSQGQMTKLQPDYVVYIKKDSSVDLEKIEDDPLWEKTKKVASEFGIPIVVLDREKIKESEHNKIVEMSKRLDENLSAQEALKFLKKVEHFTSRYGKEDIEDYISDEKMEFLKDYIEKNKLNEKKEGFNLDVDTGAMTKEENIIQGEEK